MKVCRAIPLVESELKFLDSTDGPGTFGGYASAFNNVDSYGDTILPGAFKSSLHSHGLPKLFFNHDSRMLPIGKILAAEEDNRGLLVKGELTPNLPAAEEVLAALKHGTVDGLSIGFYLRSGDYKENDDGGRTIKRVSQLIEISVVNFPAEADARINLASVKTADIDGINTIRDLERFLRDAGASKGLAVALVSRAKTLASGGEPGEDVEARAVANLAERLRRFRIPPSLCN